MEVLESEIYPLAKKYWININHHQLNFYLAEFRNMSNNRPRKSLR